MEGLLASAAPNDATLAWISLAALGVVIVVSCFTKVHPGILSIVLAAVIGGWLAPKYGLKIGMKAVLGGFPSDLFLTLTAVTLLFTQAQVNGTLERVAAVAVRGCRGKAALIPIAFFLLAFALASIGPGNIAATALLAPTAMATARRVGVPALLMAIMVAHGALAGGMSPLAPTGVIAGEIMREKLGLPGLERKLYLDNLLANAVVSFGAYAILGRRLFGRAFGPSAPEPPAEAPGFQARHRATLAVIACLVIAVVFLDVPVGMGAFAGILILTIARLADEEEAVRQVPWGVILMVCGVTVLTSLLERTGGTDLFTRLVGRVSGERSVTGVIALLTGLISVYSSTSGVVLPAFLPAAAGLAREAGGDPLAVASSIIVGGHLVDSSPLSTLGALCLASASPAEDRKRLFRDLMAWGLSMTAVGGLVCYVFFGLL